MSKKRIYTVSIIIWIITGLLSFFLFLKRNQFGNYTHWSTYNDLYPRNGINTADSAKWQEVKYQYNDEEKKAGKKLSAIEAGITENDPTLSKVIKLGRWLIQKLWECKLGKPLDSVDRLKPIEIYNAAIAQKTPVWCGTYGALFLFFAPVTTLPAGILKVLAKQTAM